VLGEIHVYEVSDLGASPVTDAEGRVSRAAATWVEVRGSVDELSARDVEIAAQNGQTHDIACRAPLETVVSDRSRVRVTEPERLAGIYDVDVIRSTRSHLRLLCSRSTIRTP